MENVCGNKIYSKELVKNPEKVKIIENVDDLNSVSIENGSSIQAIAFNRRFILLPLIMIIILIFSFLLYNYLLNFIQLLIIQLSSIILSALYPIKNRYFCDNQTEKLILDEFLVIESLFPMNSSYIDNLERIILNKEKQSFTDDIYQERCSHYSCFDLYRCGLINYNPTNMPKQLKSGQLEEKIKVYIYPRQRYFTKQNSTNHYEYYQTNSLEFNRLLLAIVSSSYYTNDPRRACLFIPNIDLLNFDNIDIDHLKQILLSLPNYRQLNGTNHLLFIMLNNQISKQNWLKDKRFMIANGAVDDGNYRLNFDIAIPIYSLFSRLYETVDMKPLPFNEFKIGNIDRKWTIISTQINSISNEYYLNLLQRLESFYSNRMIMFGFNCTEFNLPSTDSSLPIQFDVWNRSNWQILSLYKETFICNYDRRMRVRYLDILHDSEFCLIMKSSQTLPLISDSLMAGCIPVIIDDNFVPVFQERIDWISISIRIREHSLNNLFDIINSISLERRQQIRMNALNIWNRYFRTIENITMTTLDIINERVYPRTKDIYTTFEDQFHQLVPLSFEFFSKGFNYISPKNLNLISNGFTTVILTYNRFESLNRVIQSVARVPSCQKILVVWNNQLERPPKKDQWTTVQIPIQIITTKQNKLSNRFYPFNSIETEAIFAIDDDITMLNADEIEFSYQTWREFPDRIVGFPSRLHFWNNMTNTWNYDSEWKNKISLILTGAAFYHKVFNFL